LFGPEWMDGKGDLGAKIDAEALRVGKSVEEVGDQVRLGCTQCASLEC
jgi:hypothetical protein